MPRIVADTNIYISALNFAGTADKVLALGRAGLIEICISPAILDEIGDQLARRVKQDNAFVTRVLEQPKLWLIGDERALAA